MTKTKKININSNHTLEDLTSISKTVLPLAKQILGIRGFMEMDILSNWQDIVGKDLSQYSIPQKLSFRKDERNNGCLELMVLSGAFAMEIKQCEKHILEKVNTYFGYEAVNKLKIIQNSCPENFLISKKPIDNVEKSLVSQKEKSYITEVTKDICNEELRTRLESLGNAVFGQHKN